MDIISKIPRILSIGAVNKSHREKIESLINHNIGIGSLKEENLIIITNGDTKYTDTKHIDSWTRKFPSSLVYTHLDSDILNSLSPMTRFNNEKISKLVVFDQSLTGDIIKFTQFRWFFENSARNNIAIIIMTKDSDVINSDIASKMKYTLVHTFTIDWTDKISAKFLKTHPSVKSQQELEDYMILSAKVGNCLAFKNITYLGPDELSDSLLFQF